MRKEKEGISLLVLIITVVVVILAVSVILSIANSNPIDNARKATFLNDMTAIKDEFAMYVQKQMIQTNGKYDVTKLNADATSLSENG